MSGPDRKWARNWRRVPRQFLHAAELRFSTRARGEALAFESPLPADLAAAAEWAQSTSLAR
jgi:hypothetical protein